MLRWAVAGYAVLQLLVAAVLILVVHLALVAGVYVAVNGGIVLAAMLFERQRYRPRLTQSAGTWEATGERFVDAATGRVTEVRYNPQTGQRDYVALPREGEK